MSGAGISRIEIGLGPSSTPPSQRRTDTESRQANERAARIRHTQPPMQTIRRTPSAYGGNRSRRRDEAHSRPSLHLVTTRAKWIPYQREKASGSETAGSRRRGDQPVPITFMALSQI